MRSVMLSFIREMPFKAENPLGPGHPEAPTKEK